MSNNPDDWTNAEALAREYLKTQKKAAELIVIARFDKFPFAFGAEWPSGDGYVLVYDGAVQTATGLSALPPYLSVLGEQRIRALTAWDFERLLAILDAAPMGGHWRPGAAHYQDLFPAITDGDGVVKYVVHFIEPTAGLPSRTATNLDRPLVFERASLQLLPVISELGWRSEATFERPRPPIVRR